MTVQRFQKKILEWFTKNGRHDLPWRPPVLKLRRDGTCDPYKILVSEVMLQQTQVDRVVPYYKAFLRAFPTAQRLAWASPADVLRVWKGLGYNRRALNLKRAAEKIIHEYKERFPRDVEIIQKLPGVGPYTARAVAVFAFNQPHAFIETNIRRVFIHFFFPGNGNGDSHGFIRKETVAVPVSDKELLTHIEKALYKENPRLWYSALMDYGALALSDIPNPNKRSRHYTKQSRFEGSRRYARAKILDFLLKKESRSLKDFQQHFITDTYLLPYLDMLEELLRALVSEGFLEMSRRRWSLKR